MFTRMERIVTMKKVSLRPNVISSGGRTGVRVDVECEVDRWCLGT